MKKRFELALGAASAALAIGAFDAARAETCEDLVGQNLGGGVVVSADRLAAGSKRPLPPALAAIQTAPLAADVCRVKATLSPAPGSEIAVEVWLPAPWNGKFLGLGGGGFSGGIDVMAILAPPQIGRGYAVVATNAGHPSSDSAKWAHKQPAKLVDYAYRANHVAATFTRALVARHYGKPAEKAYFHGCSNGGRDALMEASRYPDDYDGIVVGAPAANWVETMSHFAWNARVFLGPPAVTLSPAKLKLITDTVVARCDGVDGVKDGVLEHPPACRFDPAELQCESGEAATCLSADEVRAVKATYRGPRTRDGRQISSGFPLGGESLEWGAWMTHPTAGQRQMAPEFFRWMVYGDEGWSLDRFDLDRDYPTAASRVRATLNSDNPDLRRFMRKGGKLIMYHGWSDAALPAGNTIDYYERLQRRTPQASAQSRLFMVPGMGHCGNGPGTHQFDMVGVLDRWVETDVAPEQVIAGKPENAMSVFTGMPTRTLRTRPLCAWPRQARWNGSGSTDEAANFSCEAADPVRGGRSK